MLKTWYDSKKLKKIEKKTRQHLIKLINKNFFFVDPNRELRETCKKLANSILENYDIKRRIK